MDKNLLSAVKDSIVQGFQWATREGPLCDERKFVKSSSPSPLGKTLLQSSGDKLNKIVTSS